MLAQQWLMTNFSYEPHAPLGSNMTLLLSSSSLSEGGRWRLLASVLAHKVFLPMT